MQPSRSATSRVLLAAALVLAACDRGVTDPAGGSAPLRSPAPGASASIDLGYGPDLFYYLRHDPANADFSTFGTIATSGTITDRFGVGNAFDALTFAPNDVGYGPNLFYYLRHDPASGFSTFGTISTDGTITDRFGVGSNFDALAFAAKDLGYGPNLFYYLRHDPANGNFSTFGTISTDGTVTDRFGVGSDFDALVFVGPSVGYGPDLFYYLRHDPANANFSTFGTIATSGAVTDRFGVGSNFNALTFAAADLGYGPGLFYYLKTDPTFGGLSVFGTIATSGTVTDRFGVGLFFDDVTFADSPSEATVGIDIKPFEFPNVVAPQSHGKLAVAILATGAFDPATVDLSSVRFGRTGTEAPVVQSEFVDVNADGLLDLRVQFLTDLTAIQCGDVSATLTGQTSGGVPFRGSDSLVPAGCK